MKNAASVTAITTRRDAEAVDELREREQRIARIQRHAYDEVALELRLIRERHLYRAAGFATFEEFCAARLACWDV